MREFTIIMPILTLFAIFFGPIFAVQVQIYLDKKRASERKKVELFKTLMATRGNRTSQDHVLALNQIDLEFYGVKNVIDKWKTYLQCLNQAPEENNCNNNYDDEFNVWVEKKDDYFACNWLTESSISNNCAINFSSQGAQSNNNWLICFALISSC